MSTSSTPIQVDAEEVGHIHVLLPTLEYSVPVGSPAVPGLTETKREICDVSFSKQNTTKTNQLQKIEMRLDHSSGKESKKSDTRSILASRK